MAEQTVMSIDIDAFVAPTVYEPCSQARPSDDEHVVMSLEAFRALLECQMQLSTQSPVQGCTIQEHQEAFAIVRDRVKGGHLKGSVR